MTKYQSPLSILSKYLSGKGEYVSERARLLGEKNYLQASGCDIYVGRRLFLRSIPFLERLTQLCYTCVFEDITRDEALEIIGYVEIEFARQGPLGFVFSDHVASGIALLTIYETLTNRFSLRRTFGVTAERYCKETKLLHWPKPLSARNLCFVAPTICNPKPYIDYFIEHGYTLSIMYDSTGSSFAYIPEESKINHAFFDNDGANKMLDSIVTEDFKGLLMGIDRNREEDAFVNSWGSIYLLFARAHNKLLSCLASEIVHCERPAGICIPDCPILHSAVLATLASERTRIYVAPHTEQIPFLPELDWVLESKIESVRLMSCMPEKKYRGLPQESVYNHIFSISGSKSYAAKRLPRYHSGPHAAIIFDNGPFYHIPGRYYALDCSTQSYIYRLYACAKYLSEDRGYTRIYYRHRPSFMSSHYRNIDIPSELRHIVQYLEMHLLEIPANSPHTSQLLESGEFLEVVSCYPSTVVEESRLLGLTTSIVYRDKGQAALFAQQYSNNMYVDQKTIRLVAV